MSGGDIFGTPSASGTFTVTLTASKSEMTSAVQSWTIVVVSALEFKTAPSNGAIAISI
ncbi:MAG: hypothetical protein LBJ20_03760 [Candidatus Methanoplasma sp.]|nr:hypothetical protein [Candidatus Methanoplasma sp.]